MKKIPLRGKHGAGKFALVDDEDWERLKGYKWYVAVSTGRPYRKLPVFKTDYFIYWDVIEKIRGCDIDHRNGNVLDNRRENLRYATRSQNIANSKLRPTSSSGYKGVTWLRRDSKWKAQIKVNYKNIYLGHFLNILDAARAYNEAAIKYFGEFARLNQIT